MADLLVYKVSNHYHLSSALDFVLTLVSLLELGQSPVNDQSHNIRQFGIQSCQ